MGQEVDLSISRASQFCCKEVLPSRSVPQQVHCLKRAHKQCEQGCKQNTACHQCHENLWGFTRDLLDNDSASAIQPSFSESTATSYFSSIYQSTPRTFTQPSLLPSSLAPVVQFNQEDISMAEIVQPVKRSRSTPSPVDRIPYLVFKKCPALMVALHNILNLCWATSVILTAWKVASVKPLGKSSAVVFLPS